MKVIKEIGWFLWFIVTEFLDFLLDHPIARILFSVILYSVSLIGATLLLVYLQSAGYIP